MVGLTINTDKTKFLRQTRKGGLPQNITIGDDNLESVKHFKYLGAIINSNGSEEAEIHGRIIQANRAYFSLSHIFHSRDIHRNNKIRAYKTIIRPIVTYGCETWILTQYPASQIDAFERKMLCYGPTNENGVWRIKYNHELYQLYKDLPLSGYIRIQRLRWAGHVVRMDEQGTWMDEDQLKDLETDGQMKFTKMPMNY